MGNVQDRFEAVAGQWQRHLQEQQNVIEELRARLWLLTAGHEAADVTEPCERDDGMNENATGTRVTDGGMDETNMSEAVPVPDLHRLRELHRKHE